MQDTKLIKKNQIYPVIFSVGLYLVFLIMFIVYGVSTKAFFTLNNFVNVLANASALLIVATGLTFVILTGALDLSVGSAMMFAGSVGVMVIKNSAWPPGVNLLVLFLVTLLTGTVIGIINGLLVANLRMTPLLTTMGMMLALKGLSLTLTNSTTILLAKEVKALGNTEVFQTIPIYVILALALVLVSQYVLRHSVFGRQVIAVGSDSRAAQMIGIRAKKINILVYVISGICAGFAGFVAIINLGAVTPTTGSGFEFTAAACVVLGGTSLFGGRGGFFPNTLLGVLLISILENGLTLMNSNVYVIPLIRGLIIFFAMYLDSLKVNRFYTKTI